jgi:hypothetical protein
MTAHATLRARETALRCKHCGARLVVDGQPAPAFVQVAKPIAQVAIRPAVLDLVTVAVEQVMDLKPGAVLSRQRSRTVALGRHVAAFVLVRHGHRGGPYVGAPRREEDPRAHVDRRARRRNRGARGAELG